MAGGYGGGGGYAAGGGGWGIRWIYALLILIVIVLQFGRVNRCGNVQRGACEEEGTVTNKCGLLDNGLIDNSVLFIIVVFLLVLCAGCWWGSGSCGSGGGYGYY
jgi:hypothetical protein